MSTSTVDWRPFQLAEGMNAQLAPQPIAVLRVERAGPDYPSLERHIIGLHHAFGMSVIVTPGRSATTAPHATCCPLCGQKYSSKIAVFPPLPSEPDLDITHSVMYVRRTDVIVHFGGSFRRS
jgi:hypothetical protein